MNGPVLARDAVSPHHRRPSVAVFCRSRQAIMVRPSLFPRTLLDGFAFAQAWRLFHDLDVLDRPALPPVFARRP
ncbi:MAG: hypothetical protein SWI22_00150 [Pseudomonadota bacterium]|nr:hypothetical protein [Pseudomonadota bacterium]